MLILVGGEREREEPHFHSFSSEFRRSTLHHRHLLTAVTAGLLQSDLIQISDPIFLSSPR